MSLDQTLVLAILLATVALFLWGRWRHDMVAVAALLACVLAGVVAPADAFTGFGHPAVITVACVLVLSRGLQTSGGIDALARAVLPGDAGPLRSFATLFALGALLSAFMNNVGAMALLMPVAIRMAARLDLAPGQALMPLAFVTGLGGMTTLIGTPPNLIVAGFREQAGGAAFGMFDFTPVGLAIAIAGTAFVALAGWRLVPARRQASLEGFESGAYLTEARVPDGSPAVGKSLREIEQALDDTGAQVVGLVRNDLRLSAPTAARRIRAGDILVVEAEAEALGGVLARLGLKLAEAAEDGDEVTTPKFPPPPLSDQNSSAFSFALTVRTFPSAVTASISITLSHDGPYLRTSHPTPPPSVSPPIPVFETTPNGTASPCTWLSRSTSPNVAPPCARTFCAVGST